MSAPSMRWYWLGFIFGFAAMVALCFAFPNAPIGVGLAMGFLLPQLFGAVMYACMKGAA
jgi:hypothetical protein